MASLETTRGRQVPAWQQANRYYQEPTNYVTEMQSRSQSATAPATRKRRKTNGEYTIQKGDTLSDIARRYGTTVQAIAQANGIQDVNKIYVGDSLNIPGNTIAKSANTPIQRTKPNTQSSINTASTNAVTRPNYNRPYKSQTDRPYNVNRDLVYSRNNYQSTPEIQEGEQGLRQQNLRQSVRRIDLAQAAAKVPSRLATDNIRITPKQNKSKSLRTTKTRNTKTRRTNTANSYPNNQYPIFKIFS